jgi:hypothetical protein
MANMATFGAKEPWMEPMNAFIVQHRDGFKRFVDEVCHLPESATSHPSSPTSPPMYPADLVSVERSMSYNTPTTIMQRLPPSSREGFPSLPYLVDQARSYAELIQLWLESVEALSRPTELIAIPTRSHADILNAIAASDESFVTFNELCESLSARTQECLARAERAERPESAPSYNFEEVIEQLHRTALADNRDLFELLANKIANDPSIIPKGATPAVAATIAQLRSQMDDNAASGANTSTDDEQQQQQQQRPSTQQRPSLSSRHYSPTPPRSGAPSIMESASRYNDRSAHSTRPSSSAATATPSSNAFYSSSIFNRSTITATSLLNGSSNQPPLPPASAPPLQRPYPLVKSSTSPGHSAAASVSNLSSAVSSDTEPGGSSHHNTAAPTALPSYEREIRHRERREAARLEIQQSVEAARVRELAKSAQKYASGANGSSGGGSNGGKILVGKLVPGFKKKKEKEAAAAAAAAAAEKEKEKENGVGH